MKIKENELKIDSRKRLIGIQKRMDILEIMSPMLIVKEKNPKEISESWKFARNCSILNFVAC